MFLKTQTILYLLTKKQKTMKNYIAYFENETTTFTATTLVEAKKLASFYKRREKINGSFNVKLKK